MDTTIIDNLKGSMVSVSGGTFMMGDLLNMYSPMIPIRCPKILKVKVSLNAFHICNHTVTQEEWATVMNGTVNSGSAKLPVVGKSWHQVQDFIGELKKITKIEFRLPTEAEWEFAARGGQHSDNSIYYAGSNVLDSVGWYKHDSGRTLHPVCQKAPNRLGLFDMSGNVWEWCQDIYQRKYTLGKKKGLFSSERLPVANPRGANVGDCRVIRGGSFRSNEKECWVFYRNKMLSTDFRKDVGFRLAY